jgi:hypothetical protein
MLSRILNITILFISINLFAQKDFKFQFTDEYLNLLKNKFNIEKNEVYYFDSANDSAYIGRISILMFMKGTMMTTIDEIREKEGNICNDEKFLRLLTVNRINDALTENKNLTSSFFRNIESGAIYNTENQLTAVFLFSYKVGKRGLQCIKHKKYLEALNVKCIILTFDENEIKELNNEKSTKLVKGK